MIVRSIGVVFPELVMWVPVPSLSRVRLFSCINCLILSPLVSVWSAPQNVWYALKSPVMSELGVWKHCRGNLSDVGVWWTLWMLRGGWLGI